MFQNPTKYQNNRSRNESCFHSLDIKKLICATKQQNGDFVAGAVSVLRSDIQRLHGFITIGKVSISIEPPTIVSLDAPEVISKISAMNPYSISWNNCLDYMSIQDFHSLARQCSAPQDTIHYGYSMNWPGDVKGSSCLSYPVGDHMQELLKVAREAVSMGYLLYGITGLMMSPPIDNPINVIDIATRANTYKYWTTAFFKG